MSGLFSSKTKSTSTSSTKVPQNYQNFLNMSLNRAAAAGDAPFVQYQGQRIADLSGNEQMGIQGAASNYGMYQPLVDMASMSSANLAEKAGRAPTGVELGAFINPYTDYVLGNSLDRLQEQSDINMTKIGSQAGMSGAFGGLRHGVLEGANLAELLKSARDLSGTTYADAYDKGMGNWWKSQDSQRASIDTMLNTVGMGQKYNLNDTDQLMKTGLTERTRNQGLLDFNFGEFMREQEDPLTKASFMSSIAAQYPRDIFTKTTKSESTTTDSPIKTLAGIGLAAAGIMSGNPAAAMSLASGASSLGNNPVGGAAVGSGYTTTPSYAKGGQVRSYKKGGTVKKDPLAAISPEILKEVADSWTLGNTSYYAENAPTRAEYLKRLIDNQQYAQRRLGQYELGDLRNFSGNTAADGNASQEEYMRQILRGQALIDDFNKPGPKDSMEVVREGSRSGDRYNRPDLQNQDRALSEVLSDMSPEDLNKYLEHIGKYGTPVDEPEYIFRPKPDYLWDALEGTKFPSKAYEYWQDSPQKVITALSRQKAKERKYTNPSKYAEGGFLDDIRDWGANRDMDMVKAGLSIAGGGDPLEALDAYEQNQRYMQGYAKGGKVKSPAWQRKEGKNPEGGLNAKGRASYNRETGGNLKAPQPEGGSRRDSFCARMGGMKKKLTSSKTANDPDSRINKALRKWKCADGGLIGYAGGGRIGPESDEKRAKRIIASKLPKEEAEREYINSVFDDVTKPRSGSFDPLNGDNWGLNIPESDTGHYDIMRMLGSPRKERPYIGMQSTLRNEYPRYGEKLGDLSYIDADLQLIKNIEKQQDYVARKPLLKNNEKQKAIQASPIKLPSGNPMDAMLKNAKRVPMPEEPYEPVDVDGVPLPVTDAQFKELAAWDKAMMISKLLGTPGYTLADDPSLDPPVYIDDSQFERVPNDPGYDTRGESYPGEFRSGRKKKYAEGGEVKGYFLGGLLYDQNRRMNKMERWQNDASSQEMNYESMGFSPRGMEFARNLTQGRRGRQDPLSAAMPTPQPFNWDRFNQARAMNGQLSNLTGGMQPNPAMGQRPDLSGYMTAMQNRMQPQQAFAGGGYVKKFDKGGDVFVGGRGFGPPTDPLAVISEKFAPLPSVSEGINPEIIYSLATQKHETGAKEYGKPNYNARPIGEDGVPLSSAAGLGQWLAESWNQIAKRDKTGTIKPRTYKQAMEGHIPSKEEQRLAWPIWMEIQKEQMGEENFYKLNNRFAHHQLGQGDYKKLLQANPDKKMREVFGDKVARNVSAYSKDKKGNIVKNETVYEYLNRLDQSMKDAEAWYLQNQENPGDVIYYGGLDPQAIAKKSLPQQAAAEVDPLAGIADVEKRSRAIDALREKEQYDAERRNWRNDLNIAQLGSNEIQMSPMEGGPRTQGRPVSPQENIANKIKSKTPIEALELFATQSKYSDPIDQMLYAPKVFPGTGTTKKNYRQEQIDKFLKAKGIGTKDALSEAWNSDVNSKMQEVIGDLGIENEGHYRKGGRNFADGSVGKGPVSGKDYYYEQVNKQRAAMGLPPIEDVTASSWEEVASGFDDYSKGARENASRILAGADSRGSRAANSFDTLGRGAAITIPMINDAVGQVGRGGANLMSYFFDPMDPSYNKPQSPLTQAQPSVPKGAFSGPNFFDSASDDVAAYYSELGDMTGADPLNAALAQGEPSAPMANAVGSGIAGDARTIAQDEDEVMLKQMMRERIKAMQNDKGPEQPTLFGLNVNMDLVKLGLGMLASDKNFGGALGEAGMNLIQSKEQEALRKSKENSQKLQELLDLRYKNAMMESMDPEVRAELARQKAASDMRLEQLKHKAKLDEIQLQQSSILSKDITKKEIERIQAKIAEDEMLTESEKSMLWAHGIDYEQPIKAGSWYDLD